MGTLIVGAVLVFIGFLVSLYIIVDAFQDEIWKGLLCFFCGVYTLYYAFVEYDHDRKWLIVFGWLIPTLVGSFLMGSPGL